MFYFQELELELECFIVRIINTHKFSFHWHIIIKQLDVKNNYYIVTLTQIKRTGKKEKKKKKGKHPPSIYSQSIPVNTSK